jgi:transposase-like protein
MSTTVKNSRMAGRYDEEFKRQAVELVLHSGKTQRQVVRELDVSDYTLWKKGYLGQQKPAEIEGQRKSPEEMAKLIREQHEEIEYLKRQPSHWIAANCASAMTSSGSLKSSIGPPAEEKLPAH